ncbi:MAG TPA: hypothetical protein VES42_25870, partial [Pilimelia sp.]|nr:hypothetical protein [Pilimelia sp.]
MRTPAGRSRSARRVAIAVTGALALGLAAIPTALGAAWLPWSGSGQVALGPGDAGAVLVSVPPDEPARGMVYRGLKPAKRGTACAGTYEVEGTGHCSHGPDAPPPGLDIRRDARPVAKPAAAATLPRRDTAPAPAAEDLIRGAGGVPADGGELALAPDAAAAVPVGPSGVVCDGDGQAGKRVQVLYAYGAGGTSRFAEYLPSFRKWAAGVDAIYDASAKETGGSRHLRYVTTAACEVDVREVEITAAGVKNFSTMIAELKKLGYGRTDRKYMIFSDSKVYCGIGSFAGDDKPGAGNRSNGGPSYGRSDAGCWNASVAAHELGHNLGAVNNSAPNSSKAGHCVDEYDVMCYKDGPTALLRTACTNRAQDQRLDCNHDDYYHTNPSPGSYLATRWNMADSQFLIDGGSGATPPVPTPANPTAGP